MMHGVTKDFSLPFKLNGPMKDPWGNQRIGFVAPEVHLKRSDFGITYDLPLVGDDVNLHLAGELTLGK
jgi:polyisoprenoid-binding protein YceI